MNSNQNILRSAPPVAIPAAIARLCDEVIVLVSALMNPRAVIREVEQSRALYAQADAIEARDPKRAQSLRMQAARIGLR